MAERRRQPVAPRRKLLALGVPLIALGCGLAATVAAPPRPVLVWNASASTPVGLYHVSAIDRLAPGDMVIARLVEPYRSLAARRHYLPANVPLVKRVTAVAGDEVCAHGNLILVNHRPVAARLKVDRGGRAMPWWRGCIRLDQSRVLLLMTDSPASFDGRYFGPIETRDVVGEARLLWRW